jgi:hypothetical protein
MEQLGLFGQPAAAPKPKKMKARHSDPEPSHEAAELATLSAPNRQEAIIRVLKKAGRKMTVKEIAERMSTKGKPVQANAISPLFVVMERNGDLVRGSKEEREAYKSPVRCEVWGLAEKP